MSMLQDSAFDETYSEETDFEPMEAQYTNIDDEPR